MKPLLVLLLLLTYASLAGAQTLVSSSDPAPDVKIVGAGWEQYGNNLISNGGGEAVSMSVRQALSAGSTAAVLNATSDGRVVTTGPASPMPVSRGRTPVTCKAMLVLENISAKTVKAVYADYIFTDPATGNEFLRYRFSVRETISPGESKKFDQYIYQKVGRNRKFYTPPKAGRELLLRTGTAHFKVNVVRVEYSDGSAWQRP